jgi:hypothetical protein
MKTRTIILWLLTFLSSPAITGADIYRWKDANGVMHFSNQPPPENVSVLERIEEAPYDAESDRRRVEEERRQRIETQKLEMEARKAEIAARELDAQRKLEDAARRLEDARQIEQESHERAKGGDCDDDYYLRYGVCLGYPAYDARRRYHYPSGRSDLYRYYYRDNNSLYYKAPAKRGKPPTVPSPEKTGQTPPSRTESLKRELKTTRESQPSEELLPKESSQGPVKSTVPK